MTQSNKEIQPMKDWKKEFDNNFPHGIFELPEFCERVTGVSPRGDEYVGMAINKEDIKKFIEKVVLSSMQRMADEVKSLLEKCVYGKQWVEIADPHNFEAGTINITKFEDELSRLKSQQLMEREK